MCVKIFYIELMDKLLIANENEISHYLSNCDRLIVQKYPSFYFCCFWKETCQCGMTKQWKLWKGRVSGFVQHHFIRYLHRPIGLLLYRNFVPKMPLVSFHRPTNQPTNLFSPFMMQMKRSPSHGRIPHLFCGSLSINLWLANALNESAIAAECTHSLTYTVPTVVCYYISTYFGLELVYLNTQKTWN